MLVIGAGGSEGPCVGSAVAIMSLVLLVLVGQRLPPPTVTGVSSQPKQVGANVSHRNRKVRLLTPTLQPFYNCPSLQRALEK